MNILFLFRFCKGISARNEFLSTSTPDSLLLAKEVKLEWASKIGKMKEQASKGQT